MSKCFLKPALMNKRGEGKVSSFHKVIRKQDIWTCYKNLKRNACTEVQTGWIHYRGFHPGRHFNRKKFTLSVSFWFASIPWVGSKGGIHPYIPKSRSVSWTSSFDCKPPLSGSYVCPQNTEHRAWKMLLRFLWLGVSALLSGGDGWVGRWEGQSFLWQMLLSPVDTWHASAVLLASCTRMWVRLRAFWVPVSLRDNTWFLRWLLLSGLPISWQCLKKPALEGGRKHLSLDRWPLRLSIFDYFFFDLYHLVMLLMWVLKLALIHATDTDGLVFFQRTHFVSSIYVCLVIISSHSTNEVRNEITNGGMWHVRGEDSLLWVSVTCLILFSLPLICPLCIGLASSSFWISVGLMPYLIKHHDGAWRIVGACY